MFKTRMPLEDDKQRTPGSQRFQGVPRSPENLCQVCKTEIRAAFSCTQSFSVSGVVWTVEAHFNQCLEKFGKEVPT